MSRKENLICRNKWLRMIYEHLFKTQWLDSKGFSMNTVPWLPVGAIQNAPSRVLPPPATSICLLFISPFLSLSLQLLQLRLAQIICGNLSMFFWSFFFTLPLLHITPSGNPPCRALPALPPLEAKRAFLPSVGDLLCGEGTKRDVVSYLICIYAMFAAC